MRKLACLKGRDEAQSIDVPLEGAKEIELIVGDGGDGIQFDQADWGDAVLTDAAGHPTYLSDVAMAKAPGRAFVPSVMPTSFTYGGQPSAVLLPSWQREEKQPIVQSDRTIYAVTWMEPGTGFSATWHATVFKDRPACEFQWSFANEGSAASKPLTEVDALALTAQTSGGQFQVVSSTGGLDGSLTDGRLGFELSDRSNQDVTLQGAGGRSSDQDLPLFPPACSAGQPGPCHRRGLVRSVAERDRALQCREHEVPRANAGNEPRTPARRAHSSRHRSCLSHSRGETSAGSNAMRRILYDKYVPLLEGKKPLPPVSWNHWFILQNAISEELLKKQADYAAAAGIEYFCIDSGWFDGDFPDGVGNWTVSAAKFPNGIGAVGDYVNKKGMKLGLWFEPERAAGRDKDHEGPSRLGPWQLGRFRQQGGAGLGLSAHQAALRPGSRSLDSVGF